MHSACIGNLGLRVAQTAFMRLAQQCLPPSQAEMPPQQREDTSFLKCRQLGKAIPKEAEGLRSSCVCKGSRKFAEALTQYSPGVSRVLERGRMPAPASQQAPVLGLLGRNPAQPWAVPFSLGLPSQQTRTAAAVLPTGAAAASSAGSLPLPDH